ncbi:MAG: hypothetical protein L6437_08240 [Kiritimatiellae bacterium]|nr:hypothetical protein [Kiritimatiellia bacterium]
MNCRERVLRAIEYRAVGGRVPFTISVHATLAKYGEPLRQMIRKAGCDFYDVSDLKIPDAASLNKTSDVDVWGCRWDYALPGKAGVVSSSPLEDWSNFKTYRMPAVPRVSATDIENAERMREQYPVWASVEQFFQIMQNLRGTENIMTDFYTQPEEVQKLIDRMLTEYHLPAIEEQLKLKPDIVGLGDEWGTQTALLIDPKLWRQFMKPVYQRMIDRCHQGGAQAWFHSCGHTREILPEFIELGLDVINPQISCMDVAEYGEVARGKITIVPDPDRQHVLVKGRPDDVREHIRGMYDQLGNDKGGLIGLAPLEPEMPLENLEALLETVSTYERSIL